MAEVNAGWAAVEITPALPCRLGGYMARTKPAETVLDRLYAQALAFGRPEQPLVVVICDVPEFKRELLSEARGRLRALLPGATLWLGATHTHSGPEITPLFSSAPADPALVEQVIDGALRAAREAVAHLHPVRAAWASGQTEGIVTNRDHPGSGEDTALDLLCLYDIPAHSTAAPSAVIGSFPCHPTVLSATNYAVSADLPGAFRRHLRARLGGESFVLLATGAAGDMSTRHTRQGQGPSEVERQGDLLASQAQELIAKAQPLTLTDPVVRQETLELELRELPSLEALADYERKLSEQMEQARATGETAQARTLETALQGVTAARSLVLAESLSEPERTVEVAAARLGELGMVAIPGELYNRTGVEIRHATGGPLLLFGYTNGYPGYLPSRAAFERPLDYEVLMSRFAPGSAELLRDTAGRLLKS